MHEMSLVRSLLAQIDELCATHGGSAVREVRLEIGPLSGVEPTLVATAFDRLRSEVTSTATAELRIEEVRLEARCLACGGVFQPVNFHFRCATCGSGDTEITRGDGVLLQSVVLDDAAREAIA
jgi:hydrogenase nickel incorporation protein HypA/HybF